MNYYQIYFYKELYMFRTDLLSIIRSLNTVYKAIGICHASYVDCLLARSGSTSLANSQNNLHEEYLSLFVLETNLTKIYCIYFTSLHVSSNPVLISRRIN